MAGTRRKPGRMGPHIEGFGAWLLDAGYTPGTVRGKLKVVGHVGRWMASMDLEVADLDTPRIEAFVSTLRDGGSRRVPGLRSFAPLFDYLASQGVVTVKTPPLTLVEALVSDYRKWLVVERGLAAPTVLRYENLARRFLSERAALDDVRFVEDLTGAHVVAFLLREVARISVGAAKGRVAELRSLLRLLYLKGMTATALASAVPPVAGWHDTGVPSGMAATMCSGCSIAATGPTRVASATSPSL